MKTQIAMMSGRVLPDLVFFESYKICSIKETTPGLASFVYNTYAVYNAITFPYNERYRPIPVI